VEQEITVQTVDRQRYTILVRKSSTALEVKKQLDALHNLPVSRSKLVLRGRVLRDDETLPDGAGTKGAKLVVVMGKSTSTLPGKATSRLPEGGGQVPDSSWHVLSDVWMAPAQFRCGADVYLERVTDTMVLERSTAPNKTFSVTMIEVNNRLHLRTGAHHISIVELEKSLQDAQLKLAEQQLAQEVHSTVGVADPVSIESSFNEAVQAFRESRECSTPLPVR
jgi:hypothetical protein